MRRRRKIFKLTKVESVKVMFKKLKIRQSNYKRKKKFKKRFINLGFSKINSFFKKFFIKLYSIFYRLNTSLKNNFQLLSNPNLFFFKEYSTES